MSKLDRTVDKAVGAALDGVAQPRSVGHTPGPWVADVAYFDGKPSCLRIHAGREFIALVVEDGEFDVNSEADARLIAAAPEMLAALREILRSGLCPSDAALARAAIAKATGQ